MTKIKFIYFFVEASKVITNSLIIDFGTAIFLTPSLDTLNIIFQLQLTRLGNKKKNKKNKIAKLKSFFLILENDVFSFQSHESQLINHLIISEYRRIYSSMKSQ